ncbi:MAG: pseudouridine synthase, partial [Cobetia crustatorum]
RHGQQRQRMAVMEGGKQAVSHYRVLERFRSHTHVRVKLETGRTHQIRVHMAHQRYPLVGDPVYGGRFKLPPGASDPLKELLRQFPRQALHARRLAFIHPITGKEVEFRAEMPGDMLVLIDYLKEDIAR